MAAPWYDSAGLISAVKRKISFPTSANTFSDEDILAFANEEMMISQVPSVLEYHEEYFVTFKSYVLQDNVSRYIIPKRAIGMRLRDVFWSDDQGNLTEMTRINPDDKAYFERASGSGTSSSRSAYKFYLEGNYVVLSPTIGSGATGSLIMYYFIRPNQLVPNDRAAFITGFSKNLVVDNASLIPGDTLTISYIDPTTLLETSVVITAVTGSPSANEFQIGATSAITATNLANSINTNATFSATNGSPASETVTISYTIVSTTVEASNPTGLIVSTNLIINSGSISSVFTAGSLVDFLETDGGHQSLAIDVQIPTNGVLTNGLTFPASLVPTSLVISDYICLANECIIPQIPSDLHNGLAERTCSRILAAIGDQQGLQASQGKVAEIDLRQGTLLDQRVDGAPQKITGRHGLLRYLKPRGRWRL